jgi:hypothetical protein
MGLSKNAETTRWRFPSPRTGLTLVNTGGKSKYQRMPPEPATGSTLPSKKAQAENHSVTNGPRAAQWPIDTLS